MCRKESTYCAQLQYNYHFNSNNSVASQPHLLVVREWQLVSVAMVGPSYLI